LSLHPGAQKNWRQSKKTSLHDSHVALPTFFVAPSISQMGNYGHPHMMI
jgi:hypothetical protein